jgi:hypothetical protein
MIGAHVHRDAKGDVLRKIYMIEPSRQRGCRGETRRRLRKRGVLVLRRQWWERDGGVFGHGRSCEITANGVPVAERSWPTR